MKLIKKICKTNKAIQQFLQQTLKNFICMKKKIKSYWLMILSCICLTACGVTKASISKPEKGTQTTITITTNNPITTNVNPNVDLKNQK